MVSASPGETLQRDVNKYRKHLADRGESLGWLGRSAVAAWTCFSQLSFLSFTSLLMYIGLSHAFPSLSPFSPFFTWSRDNTKGAKEGRDCALSGHGFTWSIQMWVCLCVAV